MKRLTDVLKAACSIGTAILIYMTVIEIKDGGKNVLLYSVAAGFALALSATLFAVSSLLSRVDRLERALFALTDESYPEETEEGRECPLCHAFYDGDECPYCHGTVPEGVRAAGGFPTEDPDYKGTDFSAEEYVSANTDDTFKEI